MYEDRVSGSRTGQAISPAARAVPSAPRSMDNITERASRAVHRLNNLASNMNALGNRYFGEAPITGADGEGALDTKLPAIEAAYRELNRLEYVIERCEALMSRLDDIA